MQAVRLMNQARRHRPSRQGIVRRGPYREARNVPAADLESQAESLKKWRDKNVITYCDKRRQRRERCATLMKLGFTKVFNLQGA